MKNGISKKLLKASQVIFLIVGLGSVNYSNASDIEIGSILMNKTITWFGQDFFNHFAKEWRNQQFLGEQQLVIEEVPSARRGTQVIITYKGNIVYQTSIAGTRSNSRASGGNAVQVVLSRVQNIDLSANYHDLDLAGDEI